jgi:rRNA maturation RNase YbeY
MAIKAKINFWLIHDTKMIALNSQWFERNEPTDVISFPMDKPAQDNQLPTSALAENELLGEVVIDVDEVQRNAKTYQVSFAQELARVMAHGTLHLLGYTDDSDERKTAMKTIEDAVVKEVR